MVVLFKMFASLIFVFIVSSLTFAIADAENFISSLRDQGANYCFLPPYPEHGKYTVTNYPSATPGERYHCVMLDISCDTGYQNKNNTNSIFCVNGFWSAAMPICASSCTLIDDLSVQYLCELSGPGSLKESRECQTTVPSGTVVTPICRSPGYFSRRKLAKMHCIDGIWDNKPICKPACGIITQHRQLEGTSSYHVELPWHAVVYKKLSSGSYNQLCGGSLISSNTVISAASCFWTSEFGIEFASDVAVAVGKLYSLHNDPRDRNSQQSHVVDIKIPSDYKGSLNYEDDIALVVVETPFIFHLSVRPVCLDFDHNLDRTQLREGNSGKEAAWNIADNNSHKSLVVKVIDITYKKLKDCYDNLPPGFRKFITGDDRFCGGAINDTSRCSGDWGVGLAFLESTTQRYYLRGVLSVNLGNNTFCNVINTYIPIIKHEDFIKQHL